MLFLRSLGSRGRSELNSFRTKGIYEAVRLVTDRAIQRLCLSRFRTAMRPSLHQLAGLAQSVHISALDLVKAGFPEIHLSELNKIQKEYAELRIELEKRCSAMKDWLEYPSWYAIEQETSFLYYAVCRYLAPDTILETGVANGHSTFFLLQALKKNGNGSLHSIDIADNVGHILTDGERADWNLHVLAAPQRKSFSEILNSIPSVDMFVHDSDHTYGWQLFEYKAAWEAMTPNGILLSDDVDHNLSFYDFCIKSKKTPLLLVDTRKVSGLIPPEPLT